MEWKRGGAKSRRLWPPDPQEEGAFFIASVGGCPQGENSEDVERREDAERRIRSTSRARSTSDDLPERQKKQQRLYRQLVSHLKAASGERNELLKGAVRFLIHAACEKIVLELLMRHFDEKGKPGGWGGDRADHQRSVENLIAGCVASYPENLPLAAREDYARLADDLERAAYRICRDPSRFDDTEHGNPPGIYPLAFGELAARLDCSNAVAERILKSRFV